MMLMLMVLLLVLATRTLVLLFNSKGSVAPAQLTIYYGGTINVFSDISPKKASASKFAAADGACVNRTPNMLPASGLSSPMSVSSHPIGQCDGSHGNKDDMKISKTGNISVASIDTLETPKIVTSLGLGATTMPAVVPQARKASLAQFLEKRKERYSKLMKKIPMETRTMKRAPSDSVTALHQCFHK